MIFSVMDLLKGVAPLSCIHIDKNIKYVNIHILKKDTLEYVKKIKMDQHFFVFHFTNGYEENGKLII